VTPPDPRYLATAIEIVTRAGAIQRARFGTGVRVDKKGTIDLVTEVDVEVEHMCRALLAQRFPDHDILAEELGASGAGGHSHRWVFDPLDGTTNFAHGVPIFCSALALEIEGEAVVGAVFDPNRQELFTAERGVGAWLNGAPLQVSSTAEVIDAILVTGFPYDVHETLDDVMGLFSAFVAKAQAIRRLGSAAIDLCWVAAGRLDAFWEERLQPWDTRAGALLVQEAGGRVSGLDGRPWNSGGGHLLASNGHLHDSLCQIVDAYRERRRNKTP
jgi:myo-inositol-1(or 4)-monophosphatase